METDTDSLWDTRFADTADALPAAEAVSRLTREYDWKENQTLNEVLIAVRNELPCIPAELLGFDDRLGRGTSFEVNKELYSPINEQPYYVAVKRIIKRQESNDSEEAVSELRAASRRLMNVNREVRVLTHPKLRSHSCLAAAIGWGWVPDPHKGNWPYLIMRYSQYGTLTNFAKKRNIGTMERRLLALDVALGLRALHDCNIVHGDVKPDNVLVYDYLTKGKDHERDYLAKLADFGSTLFEHDVARLGEHYLGTPRYNAPEIFGLFRDELEQQHEKIPKFAQFRAADCYSFGLLLWETIKRGKSFIEPSWLKPGEAAVDFLQRIFHNKENALLGLATDFFLHFQANAAKLDEEETEALQYTFPSNPTRSRWIKHLEVYPHLQGHFIDDDTASDAKSFEAIRNTASLCLQDSFWMRGSVHEIVQVLAEEIDDSVPTGDSSTYKTLPHEIIVSGSSPLEGSRYESLSQLHGETLPFHKVVRLDKGSGMANLHAVPNHVPPDQSLQIVRAQESKRGETMIITPQDYRYRLEDMFKAVLRKQPPRHYQAQAASLIQQALQVERDPESKATAHLQMAIMQYLGYGVEPDQREMLFHLQAASQHNEVARSIFRQVYKACNLNYQRPETERAESESHVTYKNPMIMIDNFVSRSEACESNATQDQPLQLGPINAPSIQAFTTLAKKDRYTPCELGEALTDACRDGHLELAMVIARQSPSFSTIDTKLPNPLHWLIMFSPRDATELLQTIISSPTGYIAEKRRKGISALLDTGPEQMTVLLPHRCLELRGTPLHWAVTAGYTDLVAAFLELGADVNARSHCHRDHRQDGNVEHHPGLSLLDLAVACHLPQMVELLLDHGSEVYGGDWYWQHSPFHMVGYGAFPFARYVAHGEGHRAAVRETIQILRDRGLDINALDSRKDSPLSLAITTLDLEPYVLEELLAAGATAASGFDQREGNLAIAAILNCAGRKLSSWRVPLLMPLVPDVNSYSECGRSFTALHYCAFFDAGPAADFLLQRPGINVNAEDSFGMTPVSLACQRGSLGVLDAIIRKGAALDRGEAIQEAISAGHIDALSLLLNAGAGFKFVTNDGVTFTVLEYAVKRLHKRPSYVRACLAKCPLLRSHDVVNDGNGAGTTALHHAAYYGDIDGVSALLEAGADPDSRDGAGRTAIQVAAQALTELTTGPESHPRVRAEINELPDPQSSGYSIKWRRVEEDVKGCLSEAISILRTAELERRSAGFGELEEPVSPADR